MISGDHDDKLVAEEKEKIVNNNESPVNFIQSIIKEDLENRRNEGRIHTRFPPEPNGYLHIGHAKSICINFGLALANQGCCNLRFDDTNPSKEDVEYVESIQQDIKWLGFDWEDRIFYASDYFDELYRLAVRLIEKDQAYVCDLTPQQIKEYRGTLTEPGTQSPYRSRSVAENLDLFARMKAGEFPDGSKVLRAKIDMASPNLNMRDPVMYRILRAHHHRTGDKWCIYPMYDFAHPLSDAIEGITHSICTLEFADHRPLYDWFVQQVWEDDVLQSQPQQIEFARLNMSYTIMSKRKLRQLVEERLVSGWNDPRMPTISGLRRRGYTAEAIRDFCERIGVAKRNSMVDIALLEHCLREDLNAKAIRVMAVLRPLKVILTNYPEEQIEWLETENNPEKPEMGTRLIPLSREIYIDQEDFMEDPVKKFFRLRPGGEVRLKSAYIIKCEKVVKDEEGKITALHCTYDPDTRSGGSAAGRKVKGTLHWIAASHAIPAEVRLYDSLFLNENPDDDEEEAEGNFKAFINPNSLEILAECMVEPWLAKGSPEDRYQFLRSGYFIQDYASQNDRLIFNRIVALKDSWAKVMKKDS